MEELIAKLKIECNIYATVSIQPKIVNNNCVGYEYTLYISTDRTMTKYSNSDAIIEMLSITYDENITLVKQNKRRYKQELEQELKRIQNELNNFE